MKGAYEIVLRLIHIKKLRFLLPLRGAGTA